MNQDANPDIETRLHRYLDAIETATTSAGDFVAEQSPQVAQEYLSWVFWSNMSVFMLTVAILVALQITTFSIRKNKELSELDETLAIVIIKMLQCVAFVFLAISFSSILKVTIAPRIVLLEKITSLI